MYKFYNVISDVIKYNQCKKADVKQVLISYYYLRNNNKLLQLLIDDKDIEILVDSGLFSYSNSVKINQEEARKYCEEYILFVEKHCNYDNFVGFFELDFDLIGYDYHDFVLPYQKRLVYLTDKIILITQKKRTIDDIKDMIIKDVKTIAIPFFSSLERKYFDYHLLIDMIHKRGKKVHLLGCSTIEYLQLVEQSDSSSWFMSAAMGEEARLIYGEIKTFHYKESEIIKQTYDERAVKNAHFYSHDFQNYVNYKKENYNYEILRLF